MKYCIAMIRPHALEEVREALKEVGIQGLTVSEVKGYGRQKGHKEIYRGSEYEVNFNPKMKLELAVPDDMLAQVIEAIKATAKTGKFGDGKIFILPLEESIRIRTDETGESAL